MKLTNKNHFDKYIVFSQKLNFTSWKKTDIFIRNDICWDKKKKHMRYGKEVSKSDTEQIYPSIWI